ncbi:hypothetical protein OG978_08480 [Streptomyces sp. NBC_01591]|uniref:hypothetical protein n=1 Tax=Streptomyces sp. NBC_01591 TaxID=2975888 RepID=UPI002DDC0E49|nr:hypothetical protein [Streptomyces sp. NBC_01591]WSD67419.1 hypothetical protein OG978_08480 [Streptomyces sp. NBC_01591]
MAAIVVAKSGGGEVISPGRTLLRGRGAAITPLTKHALVCIVMPISDRAIKKRPVTGRESEKRDLA